MNQFVYQPRNADAWERRATQSGSNFVGIFQDWVEVFQAKKDNWIRVLPPTFQNPTHYGTDIWVHYSVGPDSGTVLCLFRMGKGPCPICEAHAKAEAEGRDDASNYKPTRRVLVWLKNYKADDEKKMTAHAWAMPWTFDRDLSKVCKDRTTGELYQIDNPIQGYDTTFDVEGERPNIKYVGIQIARRPTTVEDTFLEQIIEHPLDKDVLLWRSYDEVKALFEGNGIAGQSVQAPPQATVGMQPAEPQIARVAIAPPPPAFEQPQVPPPPPVQATPPPPPPGFKSEWTGSACAACGKQMYTIAPGWKTCELGHAVPFETAPPPLVAPPPPQPTVASTAPVSASKGRAEELKRQFMTGVK